MGLQGILLLLIMLIHANTAHADMSAVPSHDRALIQRLGSPDSETRISAAVELAERKRQTTLSATAEEELKRLFTANQDGIPTTDPNQREAIALYYGEIVAQMNASEWIWLVEHYTSEPDTGVRMMLAHSLGEIAKVQPNSLNVGEAGIKRREIIWRAACAHHLKAIGKSRRYTPHP